MRVTFCIGVMADSTYDVVHAEYFPATGEVFFHAVHEGRAGSFRWAPHWEWSARCVMAAVLRSMEEKTFRTEALPRSAAFARA